MRWTIVRRVALTGLVALTMAACALPGPQHALAPGLNGLSEIAPGVYSDAPETRDAHLAAVAEGRARAKAFHTGVAVLPDRTILCSTPACADRFGLKVAGLAYGHRLVLIGPEGLSSATLGHEFSHVAMARRIGARGMVRQSIPRWFDEGLAVWLSPDPRYVWPETEEEAAWVTELRRLRDWNRTVTRDTFPHVYGSAGRMVDRLAQDLGTEGLNALIDAVASAREFDKVLAEIRRKNP